MENEGQHQRYIYSNREFHINMSLCRLKCIRSAFERDFEGGGCSSVDNKVNTNRNCLEISHSPPPQKKKEEKEIGKTMIRHETGVTFALCGKYTVGSIIVYYLLAENCAAAGRMADEKLLE